MFLSHGTDMHACSSSKFHRVFHLNGRDDAVPVVQEHDPWVSLECLNSLLLHPGDLLLILWSFSSVMSAVYTVRFRCFSVLHTYMYTCKHTEHSSFLCTVTVLPVWYHSSIWAGCKSKLIYKTKLTCYSLSMWELSGYLDEILYSWYNCQWLLWVTCWRAGSCVLWT